MLVRCASSVWLIHVLLLIGLMPVAVLGWSLHVLDCSHHGHSCSLHQAISAENLSVDLCEADGNGVCSTPTYASGSSSCKTPDQTLAGADVSCAGHCEIMDSNAFGGDVAAGERQGDSTDNAADRNGLLNNKSLLVYILPEALDDHRCLICNVLAEVVNVQCWPLDFTVLLSSSTDAIRTQARALCSSDGGHFLRGPPARM